MVASAETHSVPVPQTAQARIPGVVVGALMLIVLTLLVAEFDRLIANTFSAQGVTQNPLEYPLTAVVVGLIANAILRVTHLYNFVRPAIRTELFLKIGLVILGARISLGDLLATGVTGLVQALIMVTSVFFFTWWLAGRVNLSPTLKAVMASAVAICGVSAAIAAAGAVLARKDEVSFITGLVIITAIPLMVLMPFLATALGLQADVAGAWFGGNIDTTAAVVGAGTIYGPDAQATAAVVKLSQNVLIGFVAFALALYFALVVERGKGERPTPHLIWQRFPKFVLGFVLVSILASVGLFTPPLVSEMNRATQWAFSLAFVCIGLELSVSSLKSMGWKPVGVYLAATVFNTLLALGVAYVLFGLLSQN
jgi:uncharacterized integral membrane protein (TIGR00698 family)